jgi:hypothetical protein
MVEAERTQKIWRLRVAYWISNATCVHAHDSARAVRPHPHTHTQKYVALIAFPRQLSFREGASVLRYMYIAFLVFRFTLC